MKWVSHTRPVKVAAESGADMLGIAAVVIVGFAICIAVVIDGYPKTGYDSLIHMKWFTHFVEEMSAGELYPRWLTGMNAGLGSPVLYFYPPMAYWISVGFERLGAGQDGWFVLGMSAVASIIVSGLTMYVWLRMRVQAVSAAVGAVVYMVIPYHVCFTLYEAASISSLWAYTWMPIAMLGVERILFGKPSGTLLLLLGLTLLIITNTATATVFFGVPVAYAAIGAEKNRLRIAGTVIATGVASALISAPFLLPYLSLQRYIAYRDYYSEGFYYAKNFIDRDVRQLARPMVVLLFVGPGGAVAVLCGRKDNRKIAAGWLIGAFLTVYLMLSWSEWIWRLIPLLQKLQFPWRFNALLVLSAGATAALAVDGLRRRRCLWCVGAGLVCVAVCLSWALEVAKKERWTTYNNSKVDKRGLVLDLARALDLRPYRPVWVSQALWQSESLSVIALESRAGPQVVSIGGHPDTGMKYLISGRQGEWIRLPQFYFPGWKAIGGHGSELQVKPEDRTGLILVKVEEDGNARLKLRLEEQVSEKVGWAIAGTTLLLVGVYWMVLSRRGGQRGRFGMIRRKLSTANASTKSTGRSDEDPI